MDGFGRIVFDPAAQLAHVNRDRRRRSRLEAPHLLEDLLTGNDVPGPMHEVREEFELEPSEVEWLTVPFDDSPSLVQDDATIGRGGDSGGPCGNSALGPAFAGSRLVKRLAGKQNRSWTLRVALVDDDDNRRQGIDAELLA